MRRSRIGPGRWIVTLIATAAVSTVMLLARGGQEIDLQRPSFRSGTALVEVDVIVDDRDGRFPTDLAPSDFTILEDGRPQTIETMYIVVRTTVRSIPVPAPAASTPQADPVPAPRLQQVFVLVFDTSHMGMAAAEKVRSASEGFLAEDFRPGDIGGIVSGGKMVNDRLMTDRAQLVSAIRAMRPEAEALARRSPDGTFAPPGGDDETRGTEATREHAEGLRRGEREVNVEEARRRGTNTLRTLHSLVRGLARISGRKNVLLFSDGFAVSGTMPGEHPGSDWPLVQQIVGDAVRASVRFYIVDTRGMDHGWANSALVTATEPRPVEVVEPGSPTGSAAIPAPIDNRGLLTMIATDTGGLLVSNQNDFSKALDEIAEDTTSHYVLGYRSTNAARDGRFRKIEVRTTRSDLKVRARKGYVADR